MIKKTLGRYVYEMRLRNNLSLRDLAKETGLSYSYIHSIESDKVHPSRNAVMALSKGLDGALPDELLRLGGFLPERFPKNIQGNIHLELFSARLKKCLTQSHWTEDTLAVKTNIDRSLLSNWLNHDTYRTSSSYQTPDIISVYKLARTLDVTPDYLSGNANKPMERAVSTPRPTNLRDILAVETLALDHIPLDEEKKEKIIDMIYVLFDEE
ncbi:transcriptional regulator with XRE-family HTH domain [Salibacterium salarium]|uniref:helix-turn-helix domain-containing protein n=1 Tax=Salibacterium salarium TaxID=284579 RepID=UPI002784EE22|nr:helix-turn-helix transcriptional regulator [Salibacterium salarium]MDQ0297864.1 transcriptional regulator with XRE-family HTH domain [Salibacterium salarium]